MVRRWREEELAGYAGETTGRQGIGYSIFISMHGHHWIVDGDSGSWREEGLS